MSPAPISPRPVPTAPFRVLSVTAATPDQLYLPSYTGRPVRADHLTGITVTNIGATTTQVWVGIRRSGATGADWKAVISPELGLGEDRSWEGALELQAGDEVVVRASVTDMVNVTTEIGLV